MPEQVIPHDEVKRIFGDITDHKALEIMSSGLPIVELEKIALLLAGENDHVRDTGRLSPRSQDLFDLLRRDDEQWEDYRD